MRPSYPSAGSELMHFLSVETRFYSVSVITSCRSRQLIRFPQSIHSVSMSTPGA